MSPFVSPTTRRTFRARVAAAVLIVFLTAGARADETVATATPGSVSFRNDVMAVLAKSGCSAGACHGNKSGKGGLKLSLRGQDPHADLDTLTRDLFARRVNLLEPDQSLVLQKASGAVPHEGGQRFARDSDEYRILRRWIEAAPRDDAAAAPTLVAADVTPAERVLVAPAADARITATGAVLRRPDARRRGWRFTNSRPRSRRSRRTAASPAARTGDGRRRHASSGRRSCGSRSSRSREAFVATDVKPRT